MAVRLEVEHRRALADHLDGGRALIIARFRRALRRSGNPIVRSPVALRQCLDQAHGIVAGTVDQLRSGRGSGSASVAA